MLTFLPFSSRLLSCSYGNGNFEQTTLGFLPHLLTIIRIMCFTMTKDSSE